MGEDGTFGNRLDDPGKFYGLTEEKRFRVVCCASSRAGAFGETISRFRQSPKLIAELDAIEDLEGEAVDEELKGGEVPLEWRVERNLGSTMLDEQLVFADLSNAETMSTLRKEVASLLTRFGLEELDLSTITSSHRRVTQEISRHLHDKEIPGATLAGIRYPSRLNPEWTLWAIFSERFVHTPQEIYDVVKDDDPDLQQAASILGLEVE